MSTSLKPDDVVLVTSGCKARDVRKHTPWVVVSVDRMLPTSSYGTTVKVVLRQVSAQAIVRSIAWYVRHPNRLSDPEVSLNDGNPFHRIKVRVVRPPNGK